MKRKVCFDMKLLVAAAVAAIAFSVLAEAPAGGEEPRRRRPPMGERFRPDGAQMLADPVMRAVMMPGVAEKIGLNDEQKTKLHEVVLLRGASRELQDKIRKGTSRQAELLKAEKIDEAAVMAAIDEVFDARREIAKDQARRLIAVKSILTPEQVSKALEAMKELRVEGRQRHAGMKGERRGPRGERRPKEGAEAPAAEKPAAE